MPAELTEPPPTLPPHLRHAVLVHEASAQTLAEVCARYEHPCVRGIRHGYGYQCACGQTWTGDSE